MVIVLLEYIDFSLTFSLTGKDFSALKIIPIMLAICLMLSGNFILCIMLKIMSA